MGDCARALYRSIAALASILSSNGIDRGVKSRGDGDGGGDGVGSYGGT